VKPNILSFDTSTESCTAALQANGMIYSKHSVEPRRHNELLLPMIDCLMKEVGISFNQLDAIAFGMGPGSFVGVRIAVSVAQGLAFASNKPVIALSSLQIMAQTALRESDISQAQLVIDARMSQAYVGLYQDSKGLMLPVKPDSIQPIDQAAIEPGFKKIDHLPNAIDMLPLASYYYAKGELLEADQALPLYLDQAKQWKKLSA
jgi:tRNA threonylcarbamoyladenosine biosynthesis protein TsaB